MTEALSMPPTDTAAERTLGIMLVSASAAFFALTGVLTKSIHADPLTITCWRGFVGSILITVYVLWRRRRAGGRESLRLGWRGWLLAVEGALASIAFIAAFKFTYVANVAIIYATAPFITALLAFILVREPFRMQTLAAAAVSLCGVAIMVGSGFGTGHLLGDGLALLMTAGSALYMIMVRAFRDTPVVWAGAVSAFLLFALGWFVTDPLAVSTRDAVLLATFGAILRDGLDPVDGGLAADPGARIRPAWFGRGAVRDPVRLPVPGRNSASRQHDRRCHRAVRGVCPCRPRLAGGQAERGRRLKYFRSHGTIIQLGHCWCDGSPPSPPKPLDPSYLKPTVRSAFSLDQPVLPVKARLPLSSAARSRAGRSAPWRSRIANSADGTGGKPRSRGASTMPE